MATAAVTIGVGAPAGASPPLGTGPTVTASSDLNTAPAACSGASILATFNTGDPGDHGDYYVVVYLPANAQLTVTQSIWGGNPAFVSWDVWNLAHTGTAVGGRSSSSWFYGWAADHNTPGDPQIEVADHVALTNAAGVYLFHSWIGPVQVLPGGYTTSKEAFSVDSGGAGCGSGGGCPACDFVSRRSGDRKDFVGRPIQTDNGAFLESYEDLALAGRSRYGMSVGRMYY